MDTLSPITTQINRTIESLYTLFSKYPYPTAGIVASLDFGPTEEEAIAFGKPLREIPREFIHRLEFYGNTAQDIEESKYLLPRILECYVEAVKEEDYFRIQYSIGLGIIRYRFDDLDNRDKWTEEEAAAIKAFLLQFYEYLTAQPLKTGDPYEVSANSEYLDVICEVMDDITPYITIWQKAPDQNQSRLIRAWLESHFDRESLEFAPQNDPSNITAKMNQNKVKDWVLSDENVLKNVDLFSTDPWYNLVVDKN